MVRDLAAIAVVVVACPASLFGGAFLGCASQGVVAGCALQGISVTPFMLLGAGVVAGFLTRGWRGLGLLIVAILAGMQSIALIAAVLGRPVPFDPVQGLIASIFFGFPVVVGYGIWRGAWRLFGPRR